MKTLATLLLATILSGSFVRSQPIDFGPEGHTSIGVQFKRGAFQFENQKLLSGICKVTGRVKASELNTFIVGVPLANFDYSVADYYGTYHQSSFMFGNIRLGTEFAIDSLRMTSFQFLLTLPTSSNSDALLHALLTDYTDFTSFLPDIVALQGSWDFRTLRNTKSTSLFAAGSAGFCITRLTVRDNHTSLFGKYRAIAGVQSPIVEAGFEISGFVNVSDTYNDNNDRFESFVDFSARFFPSERVRPSIMIQIPLDESLRSTMANVVALGVEIVL